MAKNRTRTDFIILHCSATPASMDIGAVDINKWHLQAGIYSPRGLTGYHKIIRRNGEVENGRDLMAIGGHCRGYNSRSVGICLVGGARKVKEGEKAEWPGFVSEDNFTANQFDSLGDELEGLIGRFPGALIAGHTTFDPGKSCPAFDVKTYLNNTLNRADVTVVAAMLAKERLK